MLKLDANVVYKINTSPLGNRIQDYQIFELLGKGGFSEVYRAKCLRTSVDVAIKKIHKRIIKKERLFERISEEINVQSRLDHPNVLKLFTAFDDDDYVCMVLELCAKGELLKHATANQDSRQSATFTENETRNIIKQILDGLSYLHSNNVIHRDIKPANILLADNNKIKIADFGLATRLQYAGEPHMTMVGTPNYISHKVVSGEKYGPEVDLWSLGCLLYCLLVGKPPFESNNIKNTLNRVVSGNYWIPSNMSPQVRDLIDRLLQKNPQKQISLAEIYDHPFICRTAQTCTPKWISYDSGFDTFGSSSNNNHASFRFHSLDRKCDPHVNGYLSHETPKSSRRSRSHDRIILDESAQIDNDDINQLIHQTKFLSVDKNRPKRSYGYTTPEFDMLAEKISDKPKTHSCELFYENEILKRKHTAHPDYKFASPVAKSIESPCTKYSSVDRRLSEDVCPRKLNFLKHADTKDQNGIPTTGTGDFSSESEDPDDRIKVRPFSTERLKPTRHRLKNVVLSILDNGDVCVELLRGSKSRNKEMVVEVVRILKNGSKMFIYYPNKGRGIPASDHPPPLPLQGADAVFNCETLSKGNWKKYSCAAKFIEMVRSKTPKLTLYTDKARCVLMENNPKPDFEIIYYDGAKITKSRKGIKLTDNNGVISVLDDTGQDNLQNARIAEHYDYYKQCYEHCRRIEDQLSLSTISRSGTMFNMFPAILGRKPTASSNDIEIDWNYAGSPNLFHSTKYPA